MSDARRLLDRAAIPAEILSRAFSEAYEHLRSRGTKGSSNMGRVPLQQFFLEVRVALLRHELTAGRPDKKISQSEWPKWAFLYNAHRYRRNLSNLPPERRLSFETGSTADNARGLSMVFNGLEANEDYRSYCYIHAAGADR